MKFSLFLFDFDGLLVNTEELHFAAYQQMCKLHGFDLPWTLSQFFEAAHFSSKGLESGIYKEFPELLKQEPDWSVLYAEKKRIYQSLLSTEALQLMPGASQILSLLEQQGTKRCVVTNSTQIQVDAICERLPQLKTIPLWITREQYTHPKPSPDGYLKAIHYLKEPQDRIIGFEDSFRGLQSLLEAGVDQAVLVSPPTHPQLQRPLPQEVIVIPSLDFFRNSI